MSDPKLTFYGYWRSSSSWRVRIALLLKQVPHTFVPVNLLKGEQHQAAYVARNPTHQVPLFEIEEGGRTWSLAQSIAMIEWLDERWPAPPLLPPTPELRAKTRQLTEIVNSTIQPLQNLVVLEEAEKIGRDRAAWARRWIRPGLEALERESALTAGRFLVGHDVTIADVCLVPQLATSRRYGVDVSEFPRLCRIEAACNELPAFRDAHQDRQPDAVPAK